MYKFYKFVCKLKPKPMRTNVDIDSQLLTQIMQLTGRKTKKEVVNEALKSYLRKILVEEMKELRGPGTWEGDLDLMRTQEI